MESSSSTYLITGPNRGIGHGLLRHYLSRPNTTCIAAVRDPSISNLSEGLLPTGAGSKLIVVKIDSSVATDAQKAFEDLQGTYGIKKIDVIIANAGLGTHYGTLAEMKLEHLQEHIDINVFGPLTLFQAMLPLLNASPAPKFCLIGSSVGSVGGMEKYPYPMPAYGMSKAMAHHLARKIHFEHGGERGKLVAWAVYPGFVQTDTGNAGARYCGMAEAPDTLDSAVAFVGKTIDEATMESTGGHFPSVHGGEIEW